MNNSKLSIPVGVTVKLLRMSKVCNRYVCGPRKIFLEGALLLAAW